MIDWIQLAQYGGCFVNTIVERQVLRGLLEKYPTFGREKETGLLGALDT